MTLSWVVVQPLRTAKPIATPLDVCQVLLTVIKREAGNEMFGRKTLALQMLLNT
ncbi:hypothetical protein [Polaromonas sp. UC242_47]|uniref:hypothetical protein n=1 Tax=Polaromonas sp. UC242_47 TaxID=3374626 RepID=UPI00379A8E14